MRISLPCFLFCVLCGFLLLLANPGKGQGIAEINVTLKGDKIPLTGAFHEIEKQTKFLFLFPPELIKNYADIFISAGTRTVKETLEVLLRDTPLVYQQVNNNILVFRDEHAAAEKTPSSSLVTGKVTDAQGNGMPGVNIIVKNTGDAKGTIRGTTTEANGKFSLDVYDNDLLVFTSIGYKTVEMTVGNQTVINLTLEEDVMALQEVVVNAGYWQVKGEELTGSIYKVKVANPVQQPPPVSNVLGVLTGMVPGVYIQQLTGVPGGGFKIHIRGQNSIRTEANNPLYVVDGVPFTSSPLGSPSINRAITEGGNPLNSINPADIESVEVLKDADATSIYGSLGANGVVLITTKRSQEGKTKLDVNFYTGAGQVANRMDLLNTRQYLEMRNEAFKNEGVQPQYWDADLTYWDTTRYTDWQDKLFGETAPVLNARASLSGGAKNTRFLISTAYYQEGTAFPGRFSYQRVSSHLNLDHTSENERFNASLLATFALDDNNLPEADGTSSALRLPPNAPAVYEEAGNLNWGEDTFDNPFADYIQNYGARTNNLISNLLLRYKVLPGLELKSSSGYTAIRLREISTFPKKSYNPSFGEEASSKFGDDMISTWVFEPQAEYKKTIGKGSLTALIGATFRETVNERELLQAEGYSSDAFLENIKAAAIVTAIDYAYTQYRYQAFFSRLNFNWDSRYILNITARRDGSSRFGPGRQFAIFGAVGAAWIFSRESFFARYDFLSFGKLRSSYGTTGSDQIGDYQYLDTFTPTYYTYGGNVGLQPTRLANQHYGWESNKKFEVALELGFLDNRILATTAYYRNRSSNQLVGYALPLITGFPSIQSNLDAVVQNAGIEVQLTTVNISIPDFSWTTSINYSRPRNKLVSYPNMAGSPYASLYEVGKPLSIQKAIHYTGVDPQTGLYTFEDINGDGVISSTLDAQPLKSITQDFFGGFQNTFHYRRWDLAIFFQFVKQIGKTQMKNNLSSPPGWSANQPVEVMDRWQKPGDIATVQKFSLGYDPLALNAGLDYINYGDGVIGDASFIRLKNMYVSYTLPSAWSRKILVQTSKIYLQAQNLLTITPYKGLDPETQSFEHIPPLRVITGGVQLTF